MNYLEWLNDINTKRINDPSYIRENIARMSAYIMNKKIVSDRARFKKALESVAVININKRDDIEVDKGFKECVKLVEIKKDSIENKVKFLNENISGDIKFNKTTFKFFMHFVKRYTDKEIK